jgi:queuosine precursor transporter
MRATATPSPHSTLTTELYHVKDWRPPSTHGILVQMPSQLATPSTVTTRSSARSFRYLDALTTAFVVILLVSNLIAQKVCLLGPISIFGWSIGPFAVSGAVLLFPITYIFGDVFTEVYGFAASRRAIWLGFFGTTLLYLIGAIVIALPSAPGWRNQQAFSTVFGFIPRILAASLIAFWAGEFANSYTMARLKLITNGRKLWTRTIGSTVVGQAVDTVLVILLTFGGIYPIRVLINIIVTGYALKVSYEVIATPVTYLVINWLKRAEHSDAFDRHESFNPFSFAEKSSLDA